MTQPYSPETEPTEETDPVQPYWRTIPRLALTVGLTVLPIVALINVGVLVWSLGGIDLSERIARPDLLWLVAGLVFVPMLASSIRLAIWGRFLELDLGLIKALRVVTGTMIANSVTPSATGSVPIKVLFLMGEGVSSRRALTLISFQSAEDTLVLFSMVGLCAGISGFALFEFLASDPRMAARFLGTVQTAATIGACVIGGFAAAAILSVTGMLGSKVRAFVLKWLARARSSVAQIVGDWSAVAKRGKGYALLNLALAAVQWTVRFSIAGLVIAAFGIDWHPALYWLLQYLVQSVSSIVPTPGGAGGAEAGFLLLFAPFVEVDALVPAMSTWRLMFFYLPLAGAALAFFLLTRKVGKARAKKAPAEPALGDAAIHPAE